MKQYYYYLKTESTSEDSKEKIRNDLKHDESIVVTIHQGKRKFTQGLTMLIRSLVKP